MITRIGMDYNMKVALFSISKADDVDNLPTVTDNGKAEAADYEPVAPGSYAYLTDGSGGKYVLDGDTNEWKAVQT